MKRAPKKIRERYWLEVFRLLFPPAACGTAEESERPDFLLKTPDTVVGVEIQEVCTQQLQEQDSLQNRICENAAQLYAQCGGAPVWVSVRFNTSCLRKHDVSAISEGLARFAFRLLPASSPDRAEGMYEWDDCNYFPDARASVVVRRLPPPSKSLWAPTSVGFVRRLNSKSLGAMIARKEPSVVSYRERCDQVWLLLIIDEFRVASMATLEDAAENAAYGSSFDRIFVLIDNQTLKELAVRRPSAGRCV